MSRWADSRMRAGLNGRCSSFLAWGAPIHDRKFGESKNQQNFEAEIKNNSPSNGVVSLMMIALSYLFPNQA